MTQRTADNPLRVGLRRERGAEPCAMVIFGATGDLTQRKLMPALYNLQLDRLLPGGFAIIGASRHDLDDQRFVETMRQAVAEHSRRALDDEMWSELAQRMMHVRTRGDDSSALARRLEESDERHGTAGNRLFYLAVPPSAFPGIVSGLAQAGLNRPGRDGGFARIVIEKPIGHDLESARQLNDAVNRVFDERDVFRIDHYLGKETVQNLMVFRFANAIFEPLWNHKYVDHVQITVAESIGIEERGSYYEEAGTTRDMLQNHMMQLLCLIGMEPPVSLRADAIRDEKVKVLEALRLPDPEEVPERTVRAQYAEGVVDGERVRGYRAEPGVAPDSRTETYVAAEINVDNWRWGGVPFYLRAGKRLPKRVTEVALHFRDVPHRLFAQQLQTNTLALRIQPDEGISLRFDSKVPGPKMRIQPVTMDFRYGTSFGKEPPEAYERLILDALLGESTLFIRRDEVEQAWRFVDRLYEGWSRDDGAPLPEYTAGTWGPSEADVLLARSGRTWRRL